MDDEPSSEVLRVLLDGLVALLEREPSVAEARFDLDPVVPPPEDLFCGFEPNVRRPANNFQEPCKFKGDEDWFDSRKPCVKKTTAEDFRSSFYATIQSIRSNGMDSSISLVPVTKTGFPLNGAHRIAAAIALGQSSMPIQRAKKQHTFDWSYGFFQQKGLESKYSDFAMLEWTLRFPTTTVVVWPRATAMSSKIAKTRTIVSNEIGGILCETTISVTRHGLASLAFHAYGELRTHDLYS